MDKTVPEARKKKQRGFLKTHLRPLIPFPKRKTLQRWFPSFETRNIVHILRQAGVDTILDVGANVGQFAIKMRSAGFKGRIISFEPIGEAHRQLAAAGQRFGFEVAPQMALGAEEGEITVNVMADSTLSSALDLMGVEPVRQERVRMRTLDAVIADFGIPPEATVAFKIDVQGFEPEVFRGAEQVLARAKAVFIEVSLRAVYAGEENYLETLGWLKTRGFHAVYFSPVLNRKKLGEAYQMDALLLRRD